MNRNIVIKKIHGLWRLITKVVLLNYYYYCFVVLEDYLIKYVHRRAFDIKIRFVIIFDKLYTQMADQSFWCLESFLLCSMWWCSKAQTSSLVPRRDSTVCQFPFQSTFPICIFPEILLRVTFSIHHRFYFQSFHTQLFPQSSLIYSRITTPSLVAKYCPTTPHHAPEYTFYRHYDILTCKKYYIRNEVK